MDYLQILYMRPEVSLIAITVMLFIIDLYAGEYGRRHFQTIACVLMIIHIALNIMPLGQTVEAFGGMYHAVPMAGTVKSILSIGTLIVFMQSGRWLRTDETRHKQGEFYVLTLFTLTGMFFMVSSGNFLMFVIGLELASIPMSCIVAFDKYKHHSAEAGAKFILTTLFSSGLMMYGISFIYGTTGTLYFADVTARLIGSTLQIMALVFFFTGLGFKISLVPFHLWTADVYEGAPTGVTAYLSVVSKGAAAFSLLFILVKVFAPMVAQWQELLYCVTVASITVANLFAIRQHNIKRFLAFSSISQAGYLMLGVIGADGQGAVALVYYILVYMAANLAAFGVIATIEQHTEGGKGAPAKLEIADYNGLYLTNPRLTLLMTLALFSLAGIPPFAGFFSKFFIFAAAFGAGFRVLTFIALLNTIISLYYYLLIVKAMYIRPNEAPIPAFRSDTASRVGMIICLAGILLLGIVSGIYGWLGAAAL
ncbi:MAG: NADH-quinone oxidoreductase subunit N [Tannerella sp.]|jgi:NADH-quinone oxidoreductase subunit N|nr:NADH-quinone oxidoreductase subunit N [Tannerella sp.]